MKRQPFVLIVAVLMTIWSVRGAPALADWETQMRMSPDPMQYIPSSFRDENTSLFDIQAIWSSASGVLFAVGSSGTILCRDEAGWHDMNAHAIDASASFNDVWGTGADNVFAVGASGTIFHYDGDQWRAMKSATYQNLNTVWGASASDVFAVGENGVIVHYDGSVWVPMASLTDESLVYVNGSSGTDLLAVSLSGRIFHCDGYNWQEVTEGLEMPNTYLTGGAAGHSIGDLYGRFEGGSASGGGTVLMRFDGRQWRAADGDWGDLAYTSIGNLGETRCLIGSDDGGNPHLYFFQDGRWQSPSSGMPVGLTSIITFAGTGEADITIFGATETGLAFFHCDGKAWRSIGDSTPRNVFTGVWGASASDVFGVGEKGMIHHYDGAGWHPMVSGTTADLNKVWGSPATGVLAVGSGGTVLRYDGGQWSQIDSGTGKNLIAVDGDSTGHAIIVGDGGTIIRCDSGSCSPMASGTDQNLTDVWVDDTGIAYAVGRGATYLTYSGGAWSPAQNLPESSGCYGIWGTSPTDIYASSVYPSGGIFHFDGLVWQWVSFSPGLYGRIRGRNAADIFAVSSDSSSLYHFDGTVWSTMAPYTGMNVHDVWATETDIFIVGENGTIGHAARPDQTRPTIISVSPPDGASDVDISRPSIQILFSEPVDGKTSEDRWWKAVNVSITDETGNPASWTYTSNFSSGGAEVRGWPILDFGKTYTVTVAGDTADFAGNVMGEDYAWSFTTETRPDPMDAGYRVTEELWIRAQINTGDKGEIAGRWQLGGEDTTARGDRVIWGYFYADPADVAWGNPNNPDLFVKIWFDVTGNLYISYFHVSVPEIRVWSNFPADQDLQFANSSIASLSSRHVGHFYYKYPYPVTTYPTSEHWFESHTQFEDGRPLAGDVPRGTPAFHALTEDIDIAAVINTENKGPIDGTWRLGGEATTERGDKVLWGYFYADPAIMSWGSDENPDLFVKAWYDVSDVVFLDFFHVSVPDITVFSKLARDKGAGNAATTRLDNRFIEHRYQP